MKVGFDAKRIFHNSTGLGNYGRDVIRILNSYAPIETFILYNTKPSKTNRIKPQQNTIVRYPNSWFWRKISSLWRLSAISKQIAQDKVAIFHGLSGEIPIGLKKRKVISIVTIHDLIFFSHPHYYSFFDRFIYKNKFRYAAKNADKIIAISEQTKRDIIKYLHVDDKKISVVYQGCNEAFKKKYSISDKEQVQKKYALPEKFILNVGTVQERKNALTIVKAINGTQYHLIIVGGEKKYAQKIHHYIKNNNLQSQVTFLKNIDVVELAILYQLSTVFCYPSICEGFGIPIIEALFSKTPVITSIGNCFPEAAGPDSLYIDPYDSNALREELHRIYTDENYRKDTIEKGYVYTQKFVDEKIATNLFQIYTSSLLETQKEETGKIRPRKNKLSAVMITFNEILHIDAVLENLSFCDEIIVVDSYSSDGTAEKIKEHSHVKLIQRPFKNFTDQKTFAMNQATHDWVLFLDADERVTYDLKEEILETISTTAPTADAYYFYRTFMFKNKMLRFSGWQSDKNHRLFKKSKVHFIEDKIVHETLVVNGISGVLTNKLIHYSYKDYEDYKGKMIKYGQMKAIEENKKEYHPNSYHFIIKPSYKFLHHYVIRLGFLDGKKGITICYLNALSVYSRYKELKRLKNIS